MRLLEQLNLLKVLIKLSFSPKPLNSHISSLSYHPSRLLTWQPLKNLKAQQATGICNIVRTKVKTGTQGNILFGGGSLTPTLLPKRLNTFA